MILKANDPVRHGLAIPLILSFLLVDRCLAADLEWIQVSDDGQSFMLEECGTKFVPWGFNYDHDDSGRLIEDYWDTEWATIEEDFKGMKQLGANVVRIHLQFGKFMESPTKPRQDSLDLLARLIKLSERTGLYLDVTGLGCYHKQDVPAWYDKLDERERWIAQTVFWQAVAQTCADSPSIFCYDLMNEPVVPVGERKDGEWLGPDFAGKHFVQFITLNQKDRPRPEIARTWIKHLTTAIRAKDKRHLITVGLVPWSLDRPGLTSGFVPNRIAEELDFIAVHIYPETGKLDEAIETVKRFAAVGKPVLIEEMFPLKCSADELDQFIDRSREHASGWIGFYWGKTPAEYQNSDKITDSITLDWLQLFQETTEEIALPSENVRPTE